LDSASGPIHVPQWLHMAVQLCYHHRVVLIKTWQPEQKLD
jgi:hypothetical protein